MKRKFIKKVISGALACTMLVGACATFGACANKSLEGEIKIWWPGGSDITEAAIRKAKENYEAEHEGVKINVVYQSTSDFYASYTMAIMGNDFPDIAYIDHVYVQRLAYDGLIANLSDLGVDEVKDEYIDSLWDTTQYEGSAYALPMSANVLATAYNRKLLSDVLGREFTDEDYPENWEEFLALGKNIDEYNTAKGLTGNDKLYLTTVPAGTGAESMGALYFMAYAAREGGSLMSEDLTEITVASEANKRAAEKIAELGSKGYTPTNFSESKFETGKVAFIEMGPWKLTDYSRISASVEACDIDYKPVIPVTTGGNAQGALGLYSLVITKKSTKKDIAVDFIKYLTTNEEIQIAHNSVQNLMPVTKTAIANEFYQKPEWSAFITQFRNVVARPGSAAWPAIQRSLSEYVTELVAGSRDSSYLDAIQIRLEETLEDLDDE